MKNQLTRGLALALCLTLGGCSSTFIYNQLDWLIPWYADDYVDLTRDQSRDLKARLQPLLQWHREQELQRYLTLVDEIEADLTEPVTTAVIERWMTELWRAYERLEIEALPTLYAMGESLSDEQMQEFVDNLYKDQDKLEEKYLERSDGDYISESDDNFQDNLKDLLGRLSAEQKQRISYGSAQLERFDDAWLDERRRWIDTLAAILIQREDNWQQQVDDALAGRDDNRSEAYVQGYNRNQQVIFETVADVFNGRSDKQSARLAREIADIRKMLQSLIADSRSSS